MIGTTSGFESHEEVMYPSISVCSRRHGDEYRNESDLSLFQRSVNLSTTIHYITLYQKDETGHKQLIIKPTDKDMENRDKTVVDNMPKNHIIS